MKERGESADEGVIAENLPEQEVRKFIVWGWGERGGCHVLLVHIAIECHMLCTILLDYILLDCRICISVWLKCCSCFILLHTTHSHGYSFLHMFSIFVILFLFGKTTEHY